MSDKSFGDHMNRGIVKNPLLSTAVTGLSIEDLTQNAVLLPVSRTQELFGRQDPGTEITPVHENTPSGDANFTPIHPPEAQHANRETTQKDDFDVNEYFARLQGTIYVSAPINTHITEESSKIHKEDNLEEINLNEPLTEDVQQSITADIAQNFSQLPTVLPQVASAVFSSFSNMLSMKREHTPEERKEPVYAHAQVPLGVEREAPPLKEPPISAGPGNYRLTTKKKYAQIPGLSSGETIQMPTYTPPTFNQPIFTPPQLETNDNFNKVDTNIPTLDIGQSNTDYNVFSNINQYIPVVTNDNRPNVFDTPKEEASSFVTTSQLTQDFTPQAAIIPPPPMFSNSAKRDSVPNVGRTVLPPSVARRIGTNKPTISNQAPAFATIDNIFFPAPVDTYTASQTAPTFAQPPLPASFPSGYPQGLPTQPAIPPSTTPPNPMPPNAHQNVSISTPPVMPSASETEPQESSMPSAGSIPTNTSAPAVSITPGILPPPPTNTFTPAGPASILSPPQLYPGSQTQSVAPPTIFNPGQTQSTQNIPTAISAANVASVPTSVSTSLAPPQIFNPYLQDLRTPDFLPEASTTPVAEPPKIPQPPKASGNTSFRMTKKRPQYYSGPIEGVGAITNNIKPTLTPVATDAFQGSVFTPEPSTGYQPAVFTPVNVTENVSSSQGSIITPTVTDNPNQSSMFSPIDVNVGTPDTKYAFNINKPPENVGFAQLDVNESSEPGYGYNTTFDMSRQTLNTYEPPKQESAFGIIGSLKSKLSSIDINKIQNSVTTFFDPAYNTVKPEAAKEYQPTYGPSQGIEIFVANPETHPQPYSYDAHQASFTYIKGSIPNASDYYHQQIHNVYSNNSYYSEPTYGTQSYDQPNLQEQQAYPQQLNYDPITALNTEYAQIANLATYNPNFTGYFQENLAEQKNSDNLIVSQIITSSFDTGAVDSNKANDDIPTLSQDQLESNIPETKEAEKMENIDEAMKNLQIRDEVNANLAKTSLKEEQDGLNQEILQSVKDSVETVTSPFTDEQDTLSAEKAFLDIVHKKNEINYFDMLGTSEKENEELTQKGKVQLDNMFSAPLHDLSSMIADRSKEISDVVSDQGDEVSWNTNDDEVDQHSATERLLALADTSDENSYQSESEQTTDLNICETCREVTQTEQKDADFTTQLIENITAPIQLLNPVEAPLTETHSADELIRPDDFDTINQCAEILLIADETIETLQVKSATDLLDKNEDANLETNYGWRTEAPLPLGQDLLDHDYSFQANPNAIGFFANNNLFFDNIPKNASDEIKAEFKVTQDEPPLLHRQMSTPTAPPAEDSDDANSDETGVLDVQSIEQDASKDFPVFEEYVIEPSETDDDKIEFRDKIDENKDTFTNRVDRFKQLEGNDDTEQKGFDVANSNTKMPSYFDTGNYAVEAHFKNSHTSPTISRIPPGFEDHYELPSKEDKHYEPIKVPDTSTQTHNTTTTVSVAHSRIVNVTSTVFSSIATVQESQAEVKLPDFASVFGAKIEFKDANVTGAEKTQEVLVKDQIPVTPQANIEDKIQESNLKNLPDPINFFASSAASDDNQGGNRLASYFASPAKTENTKSFFELSQGQNHYRQNDKVEGHKAFFQLSQSQDHYKENISNTSHDRYIANLNLINDLTSCQNIEPSKDQVVKTVNYFTVEYDDTNLNFNKGEPIKIKQADIEREIGRLEIEETALNYDETVTETLNKCKHCNDIAYPIWATKILDSIGKARFKQYMDTGANNTTTDAVNMQSAKDQKTVGAKIDDMASDGESNESVAMMTENRSNTEYEPVKHHWFYRVDVEEKSMWRGFSSTDSRAIENAFLSPDLSESTLVPTDGGRFDVNVFGRLRTAVYWTDKPTNVRRCSWFYKGTTDARYVPYTEVVAEKLEEEYRHGITTGEWHRRLVLPNNEMVVMHGPAVMVHFLQAGSSDTFSTTNLYAFGKRVYRNPPKFKLTRDLPTKIDHLLLLVHGAGEFRREDQQSTMRPRVVRRGVDESEIEDTEPSSIDHLLLLCHGVGSACDMRFRPVEEVVDDFRTTSLQLLQSHYKNSYDNGTVGRVEVLPISWHARLHAGPLGVDRRLARVTLASIPRLRSFTNDTVLDVLLYTSPHYCRMILETVCGELNRIYELFMMRNPDFKGQVSLGGHSLGSVILYDLLCNQPVKIPRSPMKAPSEKTYLAGSTDLSPRMQYPKLCFEPLALYALGSPIAIFECIRGVEFLGSEFYLPTCRNFFNIFHPYDPIAYRLEPLVNPQLQDVKPSLIPHHKGRKRMHLELKDTMARVGADLKQKLVESFKSTWSSMWPSAAPPDHQLEKVVEEEIEKEQLEQETAKEEPIQADVTPGEMLGRLNGGRRVDYVLQEAPFEMINEYLFAMSSHVCYWESEDVMLLILREIYDSMGVQPDVTVPQQSMTVQRVVREGEKISVNPTGASTSRVS